MLASEVINKYVKEEMRDDVGLIIILDDGGWAHIHDDEVIPDGGVIAIHPRINLHKE